MLLKQCRVITALHVYSINLRLGDIGKMIALILLACGGVGKHAVYSAFLSVESLPE
jgi:hypothetical protein